MPRLGAPARRYSPAPAIPSRPRTTARTDRTESRISATRSPANHHRRLDTAPNRCASVAVLGTSSSHPVTRWPDSPHRGLRSGASFSWSLRLRRSSAQHPRSAQPRHRRRKRRNGRLHGIARPQTHLTGRRLLNAQLRSTVCLRVVPRTHHTYDTALGLAVVRRRPAPATTRPVPIRSHLTPACSGLATLAADARR